MKLIAVTLSLFSLFAFAGNAKKSERAKPSQTKTEIVKGDVVAKKFTALLPLGEYKGTYVTRAKKEVDCTVKVELSKSVFTVTIDEELSSYAYRNLPIEMRADAKSVQFTSVDEDGDEVNGSYTFTHTAKVAKLKSGIKVVVTELKEYLDVDRDAEPQVMACTIL